MAFSYKFPRPAVTVDSIIFGLDDSNKLKVLLIQRAKEPFRNDWALPGGFVEMDEHLEEAALRELKEETNMENVFIEQLYTFGGPDRDPRGRVISVAYFGLVSLEKHKIKAASDAKTLKWFDIEKLPALAFDHKHIVEVATDRLRAKVRYQPIGFELLPEKFTLSQLQKLYETILGVKDLNKRNFRSKILKMGVLIETGKQESVAHRPALLYRFDKEKYEALAKEKQEYLMKRGIDFEV